MASSVDSRSAVIGLGGAGSKIAQRLLEIDATASVLVIDQAADGAAAPSGEAIESVRLGHPGLRLDAVIREGAYRDWVGRPDQEHLRRLASWRMTLGDSPDYINLSYGTGQFRAVGRMMGLRSEQSIRDGLTRATCGTELVTVVASLSGGFGSAVLTDIVDWLFEMRAEISVRVIWLADYPFRINLGVRSHWNEAAALLESLSTRDRHGDARLSYAIIPDSSGDVISDAIRTILDWSPSDRASDELDEALIRVADRIFSNREFETPNWWRTRTIAESSGLTQAQRRHLIRGYVLAAAGGALRTDEDTGPQRLFVKGLDGGGRDLQLRSLPLDTVSPLPRILECARLLLAHPREAESINLLLAWADAPMLEAKTGEEDEVERSDPAGYELHYLGMAVPHPSPGGEKLNVRRFLTRQLELVGLLRDRPYDGTEGLDRSGMPVPEETLFRDIAEDYEFVLQQMSRELQEQEGTSKPAIVPIISYAEERTEHRSRVMNLRAGTFGRFTNNLRPFWAVRYAVPGLLAALSTALFLWALSAGDDGRETLANSADVVAGVMAGFAVCLGAIALISSIQNSSVTAVRTDRLFTSCTAVCEAVAMFEVALEKARLTPTHADVPDDAWLHPSAQLAARVLRQRLNTALEDGLFRLLTARDVERRTATHRLHESLALQVFVVFDDLSRAAKTDTTRGAALPASADNVCRLAGGLRDEIESMSYRAIARSVRSRGSLIRHSKEIERSV